LEFRNKLKFGFEPGYVLQSGKRLDLWEEEITMTEKPLPDLKTFIENVNKKSKPNGKKIRFGFTKRKR